MKHTFNVTLILIAVFFTAQIAGLFITNQYLDYEKTVETGNATYKDLPLGMERPEVEQSYSYIFILVGVFIGTLILLLLIRFRQTGLWKLWYFLAVVLALTVAFAAFINRWLALVFALIVAVFKIWKPSLIVHNVSEILLYGGLAAIFVPIMNVFAAVMLLIIISVYDMYAVWKSKHMVKMAKFQAKSNLFAGLTIPYSMKKGAKPVKFKEAKNLDTKESNKGPRVAILGGGDIAFPLIFTAVVMKALILDGVSRYASFSYVLIITVFVTMALSWLLFVSKKGRFYPAMPFISAGCFVGYGIMWLLL